MISHQEDPQQTNHRSILKAAKLIRSAEYPVVLTGAGSSTPSGVPDFRSPKSGLWAQFSPMEVASLTSFRHNPQKFFQWLRPLAGVLIRAQPNPFHLALANLEKRGIIKTIITQNIDGLHQKAGSKAVIEVHGSLNTLSCIGCFRQFSSSRYLHPFIEHGEIPKCPNCSKILKPDVVLFGEQLPYKSWLLAKSEVEKSDLLIIAGSSLTVTPVAELPMIAFDNNALLIIINLTPTYIDENSEVVLHGDVAIIVPAIAAEVIQNN